VFLLVPAHPGSPGQRAIKRLLLLCFLATGFFCQDYESSAMCNVKNEAEVDEKLSHMRPVVVLETLNLARYVIS